MQLGDHHGVAQAVDELLLRTARNDVYTYMLYVYIHIYLIMYIYTLCHYICICNNNVVNTTNNHNNVIDTDIT